MDSVENPSHFFLGRQTDTSMAKMLERLSAFNMAGIPCIGVMPIGLDGERRTMPQKHKHMTMACHVNLPRGYPQKAPNHKTDGFPAAGAAHYERHQFPSGRDIATLLIIAEHREIMNTCVMTQIKPMIPKYIWLSADMVASACKRSFLFRKTQSLRGSRKRV